MILKTDTAPQRALRIWLLACMTMVALMVFIGGVTRLTESGLSIVEWKLVTGILPPFTEAGWEAELAEYRNSPQYRQINRGMSIAEFRQIYWLEWLHRLLGRLTGLVFALPFVWFTLRGQPGSPLTRRMGLACLLVVAQGALGWLMVASGLQDDPRVSPLRLAAHLSLAFFLFCYLYWTWLRLHNVTRHPPPPGAARFSFPLSGVTIRLVTALIFIQIMLGAFVAGMDAGLVYNSWPLMDGDWIPPNLLRLEPWWRNLIEFVPMVQWQHRSVAYIVVAAVLGFCAAGWKTGPRRLLALFAALLLLQFALGVFTLIHAVPLSLASAHQMVALALLACAVRLCYAFPLAGEKKRPAALQSMARHGIVAQTK